MLRNLSEKLCVSNFKGTGHDQWACYEPVSSDHGKKRQTWKPVTGLMTTADMQQFLARNYAEGHACNEFAVLVAQH